MKWAGVDSLHSERKVPNNVTFRKARWALTFLPIKAWEDENKDRFYDCFRISKFHWISNCYVPLVQGKLRFL